MSTWRPGAPPAELPARCAPARRQRPPPEAARAVLFLERLECDMEARSLGRIETADECAARAAAEPACGEHIMFNGVHPDWQCRCCAPVPPEEMFVGKELSTSHTPFCSAYLIL